MQVQTITEPPARRFLGTGESRVVGWEWGWTCNQAPPPCMPDTDAFLFANFKEGREEKLGKEGREGAVRKGERRQSSGLGSRFSFLFLSHSFVS